MKKFSIIFLGLCVFFGTSCHRRNVVNSEPGISVRDSLAAACLGVGAVCMDAARHLYSCDGRCFLYNEDWGDVLELPEGWLPAVDKWQKAVSFHGTHVWSPDSLILVRTYSAFQADYEYEEYKQDIISSLGNSGVAISAIVESELDLGFESMTKVFTVHGRNRNGINYSGKYIWRDGNFVEHVASVQWDDSSADKVKEILSYLEHFPLAPNGKLPRGVAI